MQKAAHTRNKRIIMADDNQLVNVGGDDGDDIFVYTGGGQQVPRDVRRAKIDESLDTILARAFYKCRELIEVEGHNKLKKIEAEAFYWCTSLRRLMKINGVIEIEYQAFNSCTALTDLDFDKLEIIGYGAFSFCRSLRSINIPCTRRVREYAFQHCEQLIDAVFGEDLEGMEDGAFTYSALRRIAIPLKDNLIVEDGAFAGCGNLSRVDLVGGIHKTISSLHMESWRGTLTEEINRINQELPNTSRYSKTEAIQRWIRSVIDRMEQYKTEHKVLVKEAMTLLELALWKAKLIDEIDGNESELTIVQGKRTRQERRITSGASIVIKNVLLFLELK